MAIQKNENLAVMPKKKSESNYDQSLMIQLLSILENEKCEGKYFIASFYEFAVQKKLQRIIGLIGDSIQKYNFQAEQPSLNSEQLILNAIEEASLLYFNNITLHLELLFTKLAEENFNFKNTYYSNQFLIDYQEANDKKYTYNERIEKINEHFKKNRIRYSFMRFDDFVKNTWYEKNIISKKQTPQLELIELLFSSKTVSEPFEKEVNKRKEKKLSKTNQSSYDPEKATIFYQQFIREEVQAICLVGLELLKTEEHYLVFTYPTNFLETCKKFSEVIYKEENRLKLENAGFSGFTQLKSLPVFREIAFKYYDQPRYGYHQNYTEPKHLNLTQSGSSLSGFELGQVPSRKNQEEGTVTSIMIEPADLVSKVIVLGSKESVEPEKLADYTQRFIKYLFSTDFISAEKQDKALYRHSANTSSMSFFSGQGKNAQNQNSQITNSNSTNISTAEFK